MERSGSLVFLILRLRLLLLLLMLLWIRLWKLGLVVLWVLLLLGRRSLVRCPPRTILAAATAAYRHARDMKAT
jgi:hypothetical protein